MTRAVPALYLAILAIFVAAGSLLTARSDPGATTASLPQTCSDVPEDLVTEYFPNADATAASTTGEDARYGRWVAADGTVLLELRCARLRFAEVGPIRQAIADAESGRTTLLGTDPEAILAEVPDGSIIRQLDEDSGLLRTWFVRDRLIPEEAADIVTRTREAQDVPATDASA